jgi:hypothetical protein
MMALSEVRNPAVRTTQSRDADLLRAPVARPVRNPDARLTADRKVRGASSSSRSPAEIDRGRIPSTDKDADALANYRLVGARQQRRESRSSARLRNNPQCLPECIL